MHSSQEKIYVSGPSITQKEIDYVTDAVTHAWYGNANMYHERFEKAFAEYIGVRYAVALPSCTSALHLSLLALGIAAGDEVIVPDITWIASAAPITYVHATTVFADVDKSSWCLCAESFERCITPRTRAVIPVDLYGNMPDWDAICAVAQKHNIAIIEDAAEAIGSEYNNRRAGSFGIAAAFSFHGSKTLTTGEGGMLVTDDEQLYNNVLILRDHGRLPGDTMFFNAKVGYKYKMSSMQAALGLAQLERVEELIYRKRQIFQWYQEALASAHGVTLNSEAPNTKNTYWMVCAVIDSRYGLDKAAIIQEFRKYNIDTRPFFYPLSSIPAYKESAQAIYAQQRNTVSQSLHSSAINLPSGLDMTQEKVQRVCAVLQNILSTSSYR